MIKTMRFDVIEGIFNYLSREWDSLSSDLRLSNKSLYNLITLKKAFEDKHFAIQDTVIAIMKKHGAEEIETGGLKVPDENIAETNKELLDLEAQTDEVENQGIIVREEDFVPTKLMEILYDFIIIE